MSCLSGGDDGSSLSDGGSSSPPAPPSRRPLSGVLPECERDPDGEGVPLSWCGPPLSLLCGEEGEGLSLWAEPPAVLGGARAGGGGAVALLRGGWQQGLERGDLFVYGVEDRTDLVSDVGELYGQPVTHPVPRLAVRGGERRERGDRAERAVPFVRLVEQPVALRGVVLHPAQRAPDLVQLLVVELARAVAFEEPHGLR